MFLFGLESYNYMKYKKIVLFFCIALPLCTLMRFLQLAFTVDTETGFFKPEYKTVGYYLLAFILAFCAVTVILCFIGHRNPEHPPKKNIFISLSAILFAFTIGTELLSESFSGAVRAWQSALLTVTGVAATLFLLAYGANGFVRFKIPPIFSVAPAAYFIMRIICDFTSVSSLALITDNVLLLAAYCFNLLFFICFGKLYNKIDTEYNFRRMLATGMGSVILCFTQSVPHFIINAVTGNGYCHTSLACNASLFAGGLFIAVFIFSHFSYKNSAVPHSSESEEEYYI